MKRIPLINGGETIVDDDDYKWLEHFAWRPDLDGYVFRQVWIAGRQRGRRGTRRPEGDRIAARKIARGRRTPCCRCTPRRGRGRRCVPRGRGCHDHPPDSVELFAARVIMDGVILVAATKNLSFIFPRRHIRGMLTVEIGEDSSVLPVAEGPGANARVGPPTVARRMLRDRAVPGSRRRVIPPEEACWPTGRLGLRCVTWRADPP
jgi:hypothetical protein